MEILGGLLVVTTLLTLLGSVTALGLASMAVLGLTTEMSFKRLFFASFAIGLLAPILLAAGASSALSDEQFRSDFLGELSEVVTGSQNVAEALPRIRELLEQLDDGTITSDEFERQIEQLVEEASGEQVELEGLEVTPEAEAQAVPVLEAE